ncbi:hypothetical protein GWK48_03685 [Metallosphaera tengchongensis]|uniref:tRNA(Phe) 7-((3-amino-3-carboxypropyl)-4-demethylwyosine(37)-N(4))-methyltransferase n=1 Tax=Metallosphaera tengchongensis TaxID=1532350 RepID=A0A6N0NUT1_9CREN|nr:hypothetical protein [Metallosphaera tengchongensis]QKQ99612.1 hypothetical protein GWK48_03685 [Metallosphaera tengchongensis]
MGGVWRDYKEEAYRRLLRDRDIGYLDPDISDLLMAFFRRDKSYTYSSCSGRITVIDSFYPWSRRDSSVVYKNHLGISKGELERIIEKGKVRRLWLVVQGPILHVYTQDYEEAWTVLEIARSVGFKHSGILTENNKGILVELRTGIKVAHAIDYTSHEGLEYLENLANEVLSKAKEKKNQLRDAILLSVGDDSVKLGENPEGETHVHDSV